MEQIPPVTQIVLALVTWVPAAEAGCPRDLLLTCFIPGGQELSLPWLKEPSPF